MKLKCVANNIKKLPKDSQERIKECIRMPDGEIDLCVGKIYTVYGIVFWDNSPWYYLCSDDFDTYPTPFPWECFKTINNEFSKYWALQVQKPDDGSVIPYLAICELPDDWWIFYENLINGDYQSEQIFLKYRKIMDEEID